MLAGKLHALLQRAYPKGRDLYDLAWYLNQPTWPNPNLVLLGHALAQSGWTGPPVTPANWCELVQNRLLGIEWGQAIADVTPFIMDESLASLDKERMLPQLQSRCPG